MFAFLCYQQNSALNITCFLGLGFMMELKKKSYIKNDQNKTLLKKTISKDCFCLLACHVIINRHQRTMNLI